MRRHRLLIVISLLLISVNVSAQDLKLNGKFLITSKTRLVINNSDRDDDRVAAETLAEEIEAMTGRKLKISTGFLPKSGAIYLARVQDDKRLAAMLEADKLAIDDKFKDEGYVLDSNKDRVVIAARSGAGVFYGAQTLRQLIARTGGAAESGRNQSEVDASIPSLTIKDWPTMRWRGVHDDISRGPVPTLD